MYNSQFGLVYSILKGRCFARTTLFARERKASVSILLHLRPSPVRFALLLLFCSQLFAIPPPHFPPTRRILLFHPPPAPLPPSASTYQPLYSLTSGLLQRTHEKYIAVLRNPSRRPPDCTVYTLHSLIIGLDIDPR